MQEIYRIRITIYKDKAAVCKKALNGHIVTENYYIHEEKKIMRKKRITEKNHSSCYSCSNACSRNCALSGK